MVPCQLLTFHITLLQNPVLGSKNIGEYTESLKEYTSNMVASQPLPFHTPLLHKFPFTFRNTLNFFRPFSRTISFHNNDIYRSDFTDIVSCLLLTIHITLLQNSFLDSKFIVQYRDTSLEKSSNKFTSQLIAFHIFQLQKFSFKFRNSSNILPPFSRKILFHNNNKDRQAALRLLSRACFYNPYYAVTIFRFRLVHRRKLSSSHMFSCQPLPFHILLLQKLPFNFRNSSNFLPPFARKILSHNNDKYRGATLRILSPASLYQYLFFCYKTPFEVLKFNRN